MEGIHHLSLVLTVANCAPTFQLVDKTDVPGWLGIHEPWISYEEQIQQKSKKRILVTTEKFQDFLACRYISHHVAWFCSKMDSSVISMDPDGFPSPALDQIPTPANVPEFHMVWSNNKMEKVSVDTNGFSCHAKQDPDLTKWIRSLETPSNLDFYDRKVPPML